MGALLELQGVTAGYGGGDILRELDLSVEDRGVAAHGVGLAGCDLMPVVQNDDL